MINNNIKDSKYYYGLLRKDTILLLFISILFSLLVFTGSEEAVPLFVESIIFVIFESIILFNKEESKQIGILALILGVLMIIPIGGSLFDAIYFILGIFYIIHTTKFIKSYNQEEHNSQIINQNRTKKTNSLKYISTIPILFACISPLIIDILANSFDISVQEYNAIICAFVSLINLFNAIFCILFNKNKKYILLYINTVISIFVSLIALILMLG